MRARKHKDSVNTGENGYVRNLRKGIVGFPHNSGFGYLGPIGDTSPISDTTPMGTRDPLGYRKNPVGYTPVGHRGPLETLEGGYPSDGLEYLRQATPLLSHYQGISGVWYVILSLAGQGATRPTRPTSAGQGATRPRLGWPGSHQTPPRLAWEPPDPASAGLGTRDDMIIQGS